MVVGLGRRKIRMQELYRRGLPTFNTWIEEDEDALLERKRCGFDCGGDS